MTNYKFISQGLVACVKAAIPSKKLEKFEKHAELVNLPRIGVHENVFFTTVQVNFNAACPREGSSENVVQDGANAGMILALIILSIN